MIMTDQDHDGSHIKARAQQGIELGAGLDHQLYPLLVPITAEVRPQMFS